MNMNIDVFKNHFENDFEDDFANDFVNTKVNNSTNREYCVNDKNVKLSVKTKLSIKMRTRRTKLIENKSVVLSGVYKRSKNEF